MDTSFQAPEILLVEDNPDDAELIFYALKKFNLARSVVHLVDGQEALLYLSDPARPLPRVVFLDIKLPRINGLEVLNTLRQDPRTARLPVVMLTSSAAERDIVESYQRGANSYVVKPIDFDEFVSTIRNTAFYWLLINRFSAPLMA